MPIRNANKKELQKIFQKAAKGEEGDRIIFLGNYYGYGTGFDGSVFSGGGICPAIKTLDNHSLEIVEEVKNDRERQESNENT